MIAKKTSCLIGCALLVAGAQAAVHEAEGPVEELVVRAVTYCGSWPIQHRRMQGCEHAELTKDILKRIVAIRPQLFDTCLACEGNRCSVRNWPVDKKSEELVCKRVFWTPSRISRESITSSQVEPLKATYTYDVSIKGRVENLRIVSFAGEFTVEQVYELVAEGAARTRFEPIVIADKPYVIVGLRDTFDLDANWGFVPPPPE